MADQMVNLGSPERRFQIERKRRQFRTGDLGIPANPEDRSELVHDNGITREHQTSRRLEDGHRESQVFTTKIGEKIIIPQDKYPDINFIGSLIGYRGNTIQKIEYETGAKIVIRGKGTNNRSIFHRKDENPTSRNNVPLHAFVTAEDPENVRKAVEKIISVIMKRIEISEGKHLVTKENGIASPSYDATNHKSRTDTVNPNCPIKNGVGQLNEYKPEKLITCYEEGPTPVIETPNVDYLFTKRPLIAIFLAEMLEIQKSSNIMFLIITELFTIKKGAEENEICEVVTEFFLRPEAPLHANFTENVKQDILRKIERRNINKLLFLTANLMVMAEIEKEIEIIGLLRRDVISEYCIRFNCTRYTLPKLLITFTIKKYSHLNIVNCLKAVKEYFELPQLSI